MRFVFVNLHTDWMMMRTSSVLIFKNSAALKHKYILDYLLNHPEHEVASLINDRSFSIYSEGGDTIQRLINTLSPAEHRWILKKNGIPAEKITLLHSAADIRQDDIVICYNLLSNQYRHLEDIKAFKVAGLLHFHGSRKDSPRIKQAGINCLFNEVNLCKTCELYRRFYDADLPWIIIPFVPAPRFKPTKPFKERLNKAFSVGTITYKIHSEFIEVYGEPCDQPIRKAVKDRRDFFADTADSYSEDYEENDNLKKVNAGDNPVVKFYKRVYNRFHSGRQKKYFSFDMVEKFNDYKMHIVGEEVLGIPGIGFVEGMACGSAYIGIDSPMYRDMGLIPGEHYISYDGTPEGLRATIEYWQRPENQDELERIASNGCRFVRENFTGEKIAARLINELMAKQAEWKTRKSN